MAKVQKSLGKFTQMSEAIHGVNNLTTGGKAFLASSHLADALGLPIVSLMSLAPRGAKLGAEEVGKGVGGMLAKQGLKLDTSVMRIGVYGGLPFAGTLPGVGNWITDNVMMIGNQVAGFAAKELRIGVADQERQKFKDTYGIDPVESQDPSIKLAFESQLNYRIRHSLPSEIITGTAYKDRGMMGQATTAIIDGVANMSGIIVGHHAFAKAKGISEKYLSPIHIGEDGKITSNIDFLRSLDDITAQYKAGSITGAQRDSAVESLKAEIESGDTSLVKTIRATDDMRSVVNETLNYLSLSENMTAIDSHFVEQMGEVKKHLEDGNPQKAASIIQSLNKQTSEFANNLFSSDRIQQLQDKSKLLMTYLAKVADSTSFVNQVTRPVVANFMINDVFSPVNAALTYNKISVASEKALSSAVSIMDSILEPQKKIAILFEQKGKIIKDFSNNSFYGQRLEAKLTENLSSQGFNKKQTQTIVSAI